MSVARLTSLFSREKEELLQRQSIQDDRALHAPPDVLAVCQFLDRHRSKDAKWNKAVRSCRHPHGSYEPTIFDILRKVSSSKVDRDDACRRSGGQNQI